MGFSCEDKLDYDSEIEIVDRIEPKISTQKYTWTTIK